jgi:hypothetical protein
VSLLSHDEEQRASSPGFAGSEARCWSTPRQSGHLGYQTRWSHLPKHEHITELNHESHLDYRCAGALPGLGCCDGAASDHTLARIGHGWIEFGAAMRRRVGHKRLRDRIEEQA